MVKQTYTKDDLVIRKTNRQVKDSQSVAHTHLVEFVRALSAQERARFARMIISFYDVVHFSRQYGNGLYAEPNVVFDTPVTARYTLYQQGSSGPWKDLLFAMLGSFSHEVVGIAGHDGNPVFTPVTKIER